MSSYKEIVNDVEMGVISLLQDKLKGLLNIMDFTVEVNPSKTLRWPMAMVASDEFRFSQNTVRTSSVRAITHIYIMFKCVASVNKEEFKRHGVYPIVLGVAQVLKGQIIEKDGEEIDMDPFEPDVAVEVVNPELAEAGIIMFDLRLRWGFEIEQSEFDEDDAADLLTIANKWLLDGLAANELVTDIVNVN
jgi:hypothetical protein